MATSGGHPSPDADKADGAGVSKCLGEGQKGVEHSGEVATLEFDPENSYALCVGTDKLWRDSPAEMSKVLNSRLGLAQDHIIVLSEAALDSATEAALDSATEENVKARLSEQAAKVKDNGILFFSFSGHGGQKKPDKNVAENVAENVDENVDEIEEFYIAAADPQRMGASLFVDSLGTCKGRNAVIVMDCCYAGGLLENIRQSKWKNSFNVYTLAASKRNEKTSYIPGLGPSLFTFFMACYLEENAKLGKLPIRSSMDYCRALCPAFARLLYVTDKEKVKLKAERKSTIPNPIYDYRPKTTESGEKAPLIKSHLHPLTSSFINKLMDDPDDDLLPQAIHEYFQETAVESVRTLYSHGCLSPDFGQRYSTVFNCVLRLIVRSSAKILLDLQQLQSATSAGDDNAKSVHPILQPGHPDIFLRVMKYVYWLFKRGLSSASTAEASHSPTKPVLQMRHFIKLPEKYFSLLKHQVSAQTKIKYWVMVKKCHAMIYAKPKEPLDEMLKPDNYEELKKLPPLDLHQLIAKNITKLSLSAE
ncbi:uncharacterized protein LOC135825248 isoform X3 [Sycon ciliatum]|uniref:uncharacterized protein LOC135825248 isoform X3 n=1 Tax=Sycon ciliatum TaxID=27933 RepID=UPI0031F71F0B